MPDDTRAPSQSPFFVVFDTCTHSAYYADVHQVLALPAGAILRYEYKRYLFKPEAADAMETCAADGAKTDLDVILIYGQKRGYRQGEPDPETILSWEDSVFVPTRSARIVNIAIVKGAEPANDKFHFHMELRGFIDPDNPAIEQLIRTLSERNALPFGNRDNQHAWTALLPDEMRNAASDLVSDDMLMWTKVVDRLVTLPTQFANDVFWRVVDFVEQGKTAQRSLTLMERASNQPGNENLWNCDYRISDLESYAVGIETHSPGGHGHGVPGGTTVSVTSTNDEKGLLQIPAAPMPVVPNQRELTGFSVATINFLNSVYAGIQLETQVPNHQSAYAAGSLCELTVEIAKDRFRIVRAVIAAIFVTICVALVAAFRTDLTISVPVGITGLLFSVLGYWVWRGEFKIGS